MCAFSSSSSCSQKIRVIPEFIIPLPQSEQGIPQDRYIVQPLVDTPILVTIYIHFVLCSNQKYFSGLSCLSGS